MPALDKLEMIVLNTPSIFGEAREAKPTTTEIAKAVSSVYSTVVAPFSSKKNALIFVIIMGLVFY